VAGTPAAPAAGQPTGSGSHRAGRCPAATGRVTARTLGPVALGTTRARLRRRLVRFVTRQGFDVFCLAGGPGIRVGYPSAALRRRLRGRAHSRYAGRAVLALTANRHYALDGVRPGTRLSRAAGRLHLGTPLRIGANRWYVLSRRGGEGVFKVQRGVIAEVGIAAPGLARGRAAQRRLLTGV
ncbi:MAG: hypothetical protein WBQ18_14870, partial [Solirubrobacteraceae bacterium]